MPIVSDQCRDARKTLLLYRDKLTAHPLNMNGSFDHALNCFHCYNWAAKHGFRDILKKYADNKMMTLRCPVCSQPMKVNLDFQVAKCFQCQYQLCWGDPVRMAMSIANLAEILARKRGIPIDRLAHFSLTEKI
jgi:uncharacterized CHY-type Zn-finger protein